MTRWGLGVFAGLVWTWRAWTSTSMGTVDAGEVWADGARISEGARGAGPPGYAWVMAKRSSTASRKPRVRRDTLGRTRRTPRADPWDSLVAGVRLRLNQVYADQSLAEAARDIGINAETLRRQLAGPGCVSLELVIATLTMRGISAEWLLRGVGRPSRRA